MTLNEVMRRLDQVIADRRRELETAMLVEWPARGVHLDAETVAALLDDWFADVEIWKKQMLGELLEWIADTPATATPHPRSPERLSCRQDPCAGPASVNCFGS
jgi:hypothetical protein